MPDGLRYRAAGALGPGALSALFATTRVEVEGAEHYLRLRREGQPVILVCWHGQLLPLLWRHRREGTVVLVSEHGDGEYIARILRGYGFGTARGSSTRGGIKGLKALIRAAQEGHSLALTPDGPRGPARVFKPGALMAARVTGLPLIPIAAAASAAWHFGSWDRFMVPRPFSTVRIRYGRPHWVERRASEADLEREAGVLGRSLDELSAAVEGGAREASPGPGPETPRGATLRRAS